MTIAIIFATLEGHSGKLARFVKTVTDQAGLESTVSEVTAGSPVSLRGIDAAILIASVHERRHPDLFEAAVTALAEDLSRIPTLMLSVSLSAAFEEGHEDARDYLDEMKMRTGLAPTREALVAGAVKLDRYDYFATQVVKWVVLRDRHHDPEQGNHEFTDWGKLRRDVEAFLEIAGVRA